MATTEDLHKWMSRDLGRFTEANCVERVPVQGDITGHIIKYRIYTDNNCYAITAKNPDECVAPEDFGYLGCIADSRKPRAGETWTRGRDLRDGDLTEETWHNILADIVSYEMVKVHKRGDVPVAHEDPPSGAEFERAAAEQEAFAAKHQVG